MFCETYTHHILPSTEEIENEYTVKRTCNKPHTIMATTSVHPITTSSDMSQTIPNNGDSLYKA
jgi:hypothetical protein